jgi:hypothetical protein
VILAHEIQAYQAYLEGVRAEVFEDEELWEDLEKARTEMEIAWLERLVIRP